MADRRLQLQKELEKIIGTGVWLGDVDTAADLADYVIPETAEIGDFVYVVTDEDHGDIRGIYTVAEDEETHENILVYSHRPVYFQPPENEDIVYPCVIFRLSNIKTDYANNAVYRGARAYLLTLIDTDPDSGYVEVLLNSFTAIRFDRFYVFDSLNHWTFILYY